MTVHKNAITAAVAAEAAGQQDKFFEMHDKLFENQDTWVASANPTVFFFKYAEEIGLDVSQFRRQLTSSILRDHVLSSFDGARALGFTGTPSFTLNGTKLEITSYEQFIAQVGAAASGESAPAVTPLDLPFGI